MDWLHISALEHPDTPALVTAMETVSYGDLDAAASAVASTVASGVRAGRRVAVRGDGTPEAVAALWGIPRAGANVVVLDSRLGAGEAMTLASRIGVRAIWGREQFLEEGGHVSAERGWGPPHPGFCAVVFTSGTRGAARPVVLTGANIDAAATASQRRLGNGAGDRWLCALPLYHIGGLSILWRAAREGGTVLLEERFELQRVAALLREATFVSLVPTMLSRLLDIGAGPFPELRGVLVGGAAADTALLERGLEAGLPVLATYGMTETASQVATVAPGEERIAPGTVGRPLDGFEVRIVGDEGTVLGPGGSGRIEVRGPAVSPGFLDEPEREPDDWLRTGDVGCLDDAGRLSVLGRADSVIVTGGEKVHPAEVEAAIRLYPGVVEARVYGVDDREWGQAVSADVVARDPGTFDVGDLEAHVRSRLPGFKVPKHWCLVAVIERSVLGKETGR